MLSRRSSINFVYNEEVKDLYLWSNVGLKDGDEKMQNYLKYLNVIEFNVFTKRLKKIKVAKTEKMYDYIFKANFDVEIAVDILLDKSKIDVVILWSGDSDFAYLAKKLKDTGKKVIVYSSRKTLSWELKLVVSDVICLEDIRGNIERK